MESVFEPAPIYKTALGLQIIDTADRSHSIYSEAYNETYHSKHGAVQESRHVFIKHGLLPLLDKKKELHIFEMGMGTGLNVMLTLENPEISGINIHYHGIEKHPIDFELIDKLNYRNNWNDPEFKALFAKLHKQPWNVASALTPFFHLTKINKDVFEFEHTSESYDLLYHHAFAPVCQPEQYSEAIISKYYDMLKPEGILVSYSAQGQFKRYLKASGFTVESLPGPVGKREMTRAIK